MRLNITLPDELGEDLKKIPNKSRYIATALQEKISREKQLSLIKELQEGYKATRKEDAKTNKEWEAATTEKWE
jgi:metal-responsive CopG/Arc/MetJ family transcriptional regulator